MKRQRSTANCMCYFPKVSQSEMVYSLTHPCQPIHISITNQAHLKIMWIPYVFFQNSRITGLRLIPNICKVSSIFSGAVPCWQPFQCNRNKCCSFFIIAAAEWQFNQNEQVFVTGTGYVGDWTTVSKSPIHWIS